MKKALLILIGLLFTMSLFSQGFIDATNNQGISVVNTGVSNLGLGVSFYDIDNDGWDDLTYVLPNDSVIIYHNNGSGFDRLELFQNNLDIKQPIWVDYDNDGDADFFVTKRSGGTKLYRNEGNWMFTDVTSNLGLNLLSGVHSYGAAWADYDRDGDLDVYVCNYSTDPIITNFLCRNNGDGTFSQVASAAGVDNGNRITMCAVWNDFNNDGWPDLFVANENQGNFMYYNNGDGSFEDVSAAVGLNITVQSMSTSVSDYDNDGDWDIYVTNGLAGNHLYQNNDGIFTNVGAASGTIVNSFCWAGLWIDHNHDRFEDLHVCTATNIINQDWFLINNGDGTFTNSSYTEFASVFHFTYSTAKGDFNNDGFWDMTVTKTGNNAPFQLFEGIPNTNHYVKLTLQGTVSNRDAIGSLIEYYIADEKYMLYTRAGENYLGQNSQHHILSLGEATSIDSLKVTWPAGLVETWYNVSADQSLNLIEGEVFELNIAVDGNAVICGENSVTLNAGDWSTYLWSDNSTSQTLTTNVPGIYSVEVTSSTGYSFTSQIEIVQAEGPSVGVTVCPVSCNGVNDGAIELNNLNGSIEDVAWASGESGNAIFNLFGGVYGYTLTDNNGCVAQGEVELDNPEALDISESFTNPTCFGESDGTVSITLNNYEISSIEWNQEVSTPSLAGLEQGTYAYTVYNMNGCMSSGEITLVEPAPVIIELYTTSTLCANSEDGTATLFASGGTGPLNIDWQGQNPTALAEGFYSVIVSDINNCSASTNFSIGSPEPLELNFSSTNTGGSDGTASVIVVGGTDPYTYNWTQNGDTPNIEFLSPGIYGVTVTDNNGCQISGTVEILYVGLEEKGSIQWMAYPNPVENILTLELENAVVEQWYVYSALGEKVAMDRPFTSLVQIEMGSWAQGIYIVEAISGGEVIALQIAKK